MEIDGVAAQIESLYYNRKWKWVDSICLQKQEEKTRLEEKFEKLTFW